MVSTVLNGVLGSVAEQLLFRKILLFLITEKGKYTGESKLENPRLLHINKHKSEPRS